ncbi:hypothetical protein [Marinobacter sp.]|uniref:hypothetical protein n=1 Tax=Marinobacter sp. TaxID=50741 RepID=UPI002627ED55|nr:hypothetical protein [Marinobacter sp.]
MSDVIHNWSFTSTPTKGQWAHIVHLANTLMIYCPTLASDGSKLRDAVMTYVDDADGKTDRAVFVDHLSPRLVQTNQWGEEYIVFNGLEPSAGDPFVMPCSDECQTVNTYGRAYDDLVLALLILIKDSFADLITVSTEATLDDLGRGLRAAREADPRVRIHPDLIADSMTRVRFDPAEMVIRRPDTLDFTA